MQATDGTLKPLPVICALRPQEQLLEKKTGFPGNSLTRIFALFAKNANFYAAPSLRHTKFITIQTKISG